MRIRQVRLRRLPASILAVGLLAAACSAEPGASRAPTGQPSPDPSLAQPISGAPPSGRLPAGSAAVGDVPEAVFLVVRQALAERLARDVTSATVVSAEATTFSDGSLGCPQPGMVYTQALVEGYTVLVEFEGQVFDFRVPQRGAPVLCEGDPRGG